MPEYKRTDDGELIPVTLDEPDTSYNGWVNWETWNAYNWLTNDEGTYHEARRIAPLAVGVVPDRHYQDAFVDLVEQAAFAGYPDPDDPGASLGVDYIRHCLTAVDYVELAEALAED